jgi:hypothetical protein
VNIDGTENVTLTATIAGDSIVLGTDTTGDYVATVAVSGAGLSVSGSGEAATYTITSNATNNNTASTIVARDASGNFVAGTITATLTGNASTTTALQTARNINGVSFNGTGDITVTAAAGTLSGNTLASGVTASSLTSVGTLASLAVTGDLTVDTSTLKVDAANNRVGIGTTNPDAPFEVRGFGRFYREVSGATSLLQDWYSDNGGTKVLQHEFQAAGNVYHRGNVGIGTTSPGEPLSVSSSSVFSTVLSLNNTSVGGGKWGLTSEGSSGTVGAFSIYDYASSLTRLTINASGNVGIGTTSPGNFNGLTFVSPILDVVGSINIRGISGNGVSALQMGGDTFRKAIIIAPIGTETPYLAFGVATGGSSSSASEFMRITNAGNVGIGVTSPNGLLHLNSSVVNKELLILRNTNVAVGASVPIFLSSNSGGTLTNVSIENGGAGSFIVRTGATTEFGYGSVRLSITNAGNVGIGTASPTQQLHTTGFVRLFGISVNETGGTISAFIGYEKTWIGTGSSNSLVIASETGNSIKFYTNGTATERASINTDGRFTMSAAVSAASGTHSLIDNGASPNTVRLYNDTDSNNTGNRFLVCDAGASILRAEIRSNGGLANYSANNVNLASDERLKKDISPLASTWDKLKVMEVVNFRYKDCNEGDPALYGVIAQQVQPIVPELVVVTREAKEAQDAIEAQDAVLGEDGNVLTPAVEAKPAVEAAPEYYGIREQPMYWLAIKALQEAMARIEALEAKNAVLEADIQQLKQ